MRAVGGDVAVYLLAAHALHVGFQLTVTLVVYPALAEVPTDRWAAAHRAHSRRITVVVGLVYLTLAGASLVALLQLLGVVGASANAGGLATAATLVALVGAAGAAASTAFGAARTHGRLAQRRERRLVELLLWQDRLRLGFAGLGALGALTLVLVLPS